MLWNLVVILVAFLALSIPRVVIAQSMYGDRFEPRPSMYGERVEPSYSNYGRQESPAGNQTILDQQQEHARQIQREREQHSPYLMTPSYTNESHYEQDRSYGQPYDLRPNTMRQKQE
jgi:hypothetical protein